MEELDFNEVDPEADQQADKDTPAADDLWSGYCPACSHCVQEYTLPTANTNANNVADNTNTESNNSSAVTISSLVNNVAPIPSITATTAVTTTPVNNVAPITPVPHVITAATQAAPNINNVALIAPAPHIMAAATQAAPNFHTNMSVSQCWYVVTAGRKTGVFQGWHNVHILVIGVPGACFACHSSLSAAQAAYAQALNDGSVSHLLF
ncbi:uncharacterized protein EDB91DRAFT_1251447 [Suillus paluster]|uniref:uncharacterized protein n=1 Tax=Suillus paluster TaxID=48578 RepID=UPI001B88663C|nr:uncharacterized protein EDB91DRAFT_1251447 [Suillus paluster]KAG1733205.1 hypothetical protein EDB91DRAFT_1251447 [Suillus paluster]